MLEIVLFSSIAGIVGTGLGGVVGLVFGRKSEATVSFLLSLAGGVMLSIVFFELIPEAIELSGPMTAVFSIILGVGCVWLLNYALDRMTDSRATHVHPEELRHQEELLTPSTNRQGMLRSGFVMFAAIALHNLPEGVAIGSGGAHDATMGIMLAAMIMIHNIPEGISIAVPLIEGGMQRGKAVALTALSGTPTLLGGLIGAFIGGIGDIFVAISLALAGGAMLYVTFCEILPQAILLDHTRRPALFTVTGVLFGLILVYALS